MRRKYFTNSLLLSMLLIFASAVSSMAGVVEPLSKEQLSRMTEQEAEARVLQLAKRVEEIKELDVRKLPREQRKQIKGEMREIKKELDFLNNRVTLSLGALIIIILLIILIF